MSLDDWQMVFIFVIILFLTAAISPIVMTFLPTYGESFFALAVLGEDEEADDYYPGDDPNIQVGETMNWTVYAYNHMGEAQYISLIVRLLTSTMPAPNSTLCEPSIAPELFRVEQFLSNNQTWLYPIIWNLNSTVSNASGVNIQVLNINGETVETDVTAIDGEQFRIVIELWVYDKESDDFTFKWLSAGEYRCVWNQIWFTSTQSS